MAYGSDSNLAEPIERLREVAADEGMLDSIVDLEIGEQRVLY